MIKSFGEWRGKPAHIYEISNGSLSVGISDVGAAVQYIQVKTPSGFTDVCPGFDDAGEWAKSGTYLGATVGRVANRISGAKFSLGGKMYNLSRNDGQNCLHGGEDGFDKRFFKVLTEGAQGDDWRGNMLQLSLFSPDGDMGFPGNLNLLVTYKLEGSSLGIIYKARSDKDTLWAPTCHAYFNLGGASAAASSCGDMLRINADCFTPSGAGLIPTGEVRRVEGTPFDFRDFRAMGERIDEKDEQLAIAGGYDHNFVLRGEHAACAFSRESGIKLDIYTDMPGLHFYSGNFLGGNSAFGALAPRAAYALEAQFFPDAANIPSFEKPLLKAGEGQTHRIEYKFGRV